MPRGVNPGGSIRRAPRRFARDWTEAAKSSMISARSRGAAVIDFEPSDEQKLVIETVRAFAASEVRPRAREAYETRKLPDAVIARAHELGLVANSLPEEHGGGGARSAVTAALVIEELAWGDLAIALAILSPALVALPVCEFGSPSQRRAWLPAFTGERFVPGSLAVVEPSFRFDAERPATRARRAGGGFSLSGRKCFVPWQSGGELVIVSASTEEGAALFAVPRDARGLEATAEHNLGIGALPTVELALDDVRISEEARLGGGGGAELARLLVRGRVALAAAAVGVARAAYEVARDYAKQREAFGAPIATRQAIAFKLADMAIEIDGARLLVWEAAWTLDQGRDGAREAALAREQAVRIALEVADGAVQVLGGHGYTREYLPEMHLRDARGFASFEALALV
jgi:alkylation response protein AidB-like acyl-CoA dehydrogenase